MTLKESFLPLESFVQENEADMSLNQRKLYAQTLKQTGTNVELYDTNKSEAQNEKEIEELNTHLMQIEEREQVRQDALANKNKMRALAQKTSLDDPAEDRTVTVITPNSVKEEDLVIWLVQNKKVSLP